MVSVVPLVIILSPIELILLANPSVNTLAMTACTCTSTKLALALAPFLCKVRLNTKITNSATILALLRNSLLGMVLVSPLVPSLTFKALSKADSIATSLVKILNMLIGMEHVMQLVLRLSFQEQKAAKNSALSLVLSESTFILTIHVSQIVSSPSRKESKVKAIIATSNLPTDILALLANTITGIPPA